MQLGRRYSFVVVVILQVWKVFKVFRIQFRWRSSKIHVSVVAPFSVFHSFPNNKQILGNTADDLLSHSLPTEQAKKLDEDEQRTVEYDAQVHHNFITIFFPMECLLKSFLHASDVSLPPPGVPLPVLSALPSVYRRHCILPGLLPSKEVSRCQSLVS